MNLINKQPNITQRILAERTGVSLGSIHYCLQELVKEGWVKAGNFNRNPNKSLYLYLLTPEGVKKKITISY